MNANIILSHLTKLATPFALMAGLLLIVAAATPPANPRIGVVDSKRIAAESKTIRKMIEDAAAKAETMRSDLEKKKADYNSRLDAYSLQKSVVSDEEKSRRESAIQEIRDEIEVLEIRLGREVKRSQEGMVGPMGLRILAAIREESKDANLSVVFTSDDLVHYDEKCDITAEVIARLDKK